MTGHLPELIARLLELGILPASAVDDTREQYSANDADSEVSLDQLCHQGLLSQFQRIEIEAGRMDQLVVGDYVKLDCLGQGGMGAVYKARRIATGDIIALKMLPAVLRDDPNALRRLSREVKATTELKHPRIIQTYSLEQTPQGPVLAMEYVDGVNLHELIQRDGPLKPEQAMDYLRQAADGLEHAHNRNVIHRDVKPSNLMLDRGGQVRVLDFGLARLVEQATHGDATTLSELTQAGEVLGTVEFMAPEQAFDSKSVDGRADVYSLGCTLYFLLSGSPPFDGETAVEIMLAHSEAEIPRLPIRESRRLRHGVDAMYRKMLAKQPEARYGSMEQLVSTLDQLNESRMVAQARVRNTVTATLIGAMLLSVVLAILVQLGTLFPSPQVAASDVRIMADRSEPVEYPRSDWSSFAWEPGPEQNVIPGLLPRPAALVGYEAWQLETKQPRCGITSVAWSPDWQTVFYGTLSGKIWSYDIHRRELKRILPAYAGRVSAIAVHPQRESIATVGAYEKVVRLWDRQFAPQRVLSGHTAGITSVAWSTDGRTLASAGGHGKVRLWSSGGFAGPVLQGHKGKVTDLAWRSDDRQLVSAGLDGTIRIWNADGSAEQVLEHSKIETDESGKPLPTASTDPATADDRVGVLSVAWNSAGTKLLSGGADATVRLWDAATAQAEVLDKQGGAVEQVGWSPDEQWFASRTDWTNKKVSVWEAKADPRVAITLPGDATTFAWHDSSFLLVIGESTGAVRLWGLDGSQYLEISPPRRFGGVRDMDWHPNSEQIISAHMDGKLRIWDRGGRLLQTIDAHDGWVESVRWNRVGDLIVSGGVDRTVSVWDQHGEPVKTFRGHAQRVARGGLAWSADDRWIASASIDGTVRLWSLDGRETRVLEGHRGQLCSLRWSPDGSCLASLDQLGGVRLWRPDGELIAEMAGKRGTDGAVTWSPDSQTVATILSGNFRMWDKTGKLLRSDKLTGGSLRWSPAGDRLVAGGSEKATIWDPHEAPGEKRQFVKHFPGAHSVAWHPTEDLVVSGGIDDTIHAWDPTTGESHWVTITLDGDQYATFDPAGQFIAGNPQALDRHMVVLARDQSGRTETVRVREFFLRLGIDIYE